MDFVKIKTSINKNGTIEVFPDFQTGRIKDLMIRGHAFYAIWDEEKGMWSTDEIDVQRIVDKETLKEAEKINLGGAVEIKTLKNFGDGYWTKYKQFVQSHPDNAKQLDNKVVFLNTKVTKKDYVSKRLPYSLEDGDCSAYDEIIGTLYSEEERQKIEWAIGAILSGEAKDIQKFIVFYGPPGAGKGTILKIIEQLFSIKDENGSEIGYCASFEASELASKSSTFSTEVFANNPLVAIQPDGDLSRIEDNTRLNSIISHERMVMHEKYKSAYFSKVNCFLFMGTNKPVKITDAKSGIIRRLIDVNPTGNTIEPDRYFELLDKIPFELGAIAYHCIQVFKKVGKNYYMNYRPLSMMFKTDAFYNFVEDSSPIFRKEDGTTLKAAWEMWTRYKEETSIELKLPQYKFREELKNYFREFHDVCRVNGKQVRSYFSGFIDAKFVKQPPIDLSDVPGAGWLYFNSSKSLFDTQYADCPAQLATTKGTPRMKWDECNTRLKDIFTTSLHYVKVPENHIVIDFDIPGDDGEKSLEKNLEMANKWPKTYAELSKSGAGIHLHYIYDGDVNELSHMYDDKIEIKIFTGNSSLRRKLTKCNDIPIAHISSGLPLKGDKKLINFEAVRSERHLRNLIMKNLNKEIHGYTTPSIIFIKDILDEVYDKGEPSYDVRDLEKDVLVFASNSTHQSQKCKRLVLQMHFCSRDVEENERYGSAILSPNKWDEDTPITFFDVEVFPNLFIVVFKTVGKEPVKMINPSPTDIAGLLKYKLVGFNCRKYDNHILYARLLGYDNYNLYLLSQNIIAGHRDAMFAQAYSISYTDVYDFVSTKMNLKKYEIELGIHHQELGYHWDQPVPEENWDEVAAYCVNDVIATEAVFNARKQDFIAREILADLSGLTVNDTTNQHTTRLIVGSDPNPQSKFIYTDLSKMFKGYTYGYSEKEKKFVSTYRGEVVGEGGYVYSEPGMYGNVALLDIMSMHPTSAIVMKVFGEYTTNFEQLYNIRVAIKHKEFDKVKEMFDGKLARYLDDPEQADALAYALKIAINSVYGLTSAKFDNKLRDPRNKDNMVAKRGALFMIDLKHAVQEKGYTVAHIKTDSIKIPDATPEIIKFVMDMGKKYGYTFEHEATYEKMCLVNDAVYIAKYSKSKDINGKHAGEWTATGAQFQHPYVFKYLFSKEPIEFKDMCETKTVQSALYLDFNENLPDVSDIEKEKDKITKEYKKQARTIDEANAYLETMKDLNERSSKGHKYVFVGRAGQFCPIKPNCGGALLMREKDGKYYSVTGTKGYRWLESERVKDLGKQDDIDLGYFKELVDEAVENISQYGDFYHFVSDEPYITVPKYESNIDIYSDELPF